MKKKSMILAVASLGSMAIIGTGFAGWVISANAEVHASGVMVAYDVVDHRLKIEDGIGWEHKKATTGDDAKVGTIIFGRLSDQDMGKITDPWLTCEGTGMEVEQLTNTYSFKVSTQDTADNGTFKVSLATTKGFEIIGDTDNVWPTLTSTENYKAKEFIEADPDIKFDKEVYELGSEATEVKMTITFKWGKAFGNQNPYNFYNATPKSTVSSEVMDAAFNNINALKKADGLGFKVNLDVVRQ